MNTPETVGLTFLVITNQYWCKNTVFAKAKHEASRNGVFQKGERRKYQVFLVHEDTVVGETGDLEFPNDLAAETALYLGVM
jgi:hypothetical protein